MDSLQETLQSEQRAAEVLKSEIHNLRLLLQSSDKALASARNELRAQSEHQQETSHISYSLISTQLEKAQQEWELQNRTLQDSFDQLQAEAKFEADQAGRQLHDKQQEIDQLKADVKGLNNSLQAEQERTNSLTSQLRENKGSSEELIESIDQNTQLRKQVSDLTTLNQQQLTKLADLEMNLTNAYERIASLEQKIQQDEDVLFNLMNQTKDLRSELSQKEETIIYLTDIKDIIAKCNTTCSEGENIREQNQTLKAEICEMKETLEKKMISNKIEVEVLQDELAYATEEVERLTKILDEQNILLQTSQESTAQMKAIIKVLQQKLGRL